MTNATTIAMTGSDCSVPVVPRPIGIFPSVADNTDISIFIPPLKYFELNILYANLNNCQR